MVAGLTLNIDIWRMSTTTDDVVGGASITGTVAYASVCAAITPRRPTQIALEQGLEVDAIYDLTTTQYGISIHERDEVQVVKPVDHPLYGLRFRVMGVQPSRRHGHAGHQHATLSRIRQSRSQQ